MGCKFSWCVSSNKPWFGKHFCNISNPFNSSVRAIPSWPFPASVACSWHRWLQLYVIIYLKRYFCRDQHRRRTQPMKLLEEKCIYYINKHIQSSGEDLPHKCLTKVLKSSFSHLLVLCKIVSCLGIVFLISKTYCTQIHLFIFNSHLSSSFNNNIVTVVMKWLKWGYSMVCMFCNYCMVLNE